MRFGIAGPGAVAHQCIEVEDNMSVTVHFITGAKGSVEAPTLWGPGLPRKQ